MKREKAGACVRRFLERVQLEETKILLRNKDSVKGRFPFMTIKKSFFFFCFIFILVVKNTWVKGYFDIESI